jgi:polyisoprenyl-teichoic acid--peptidoglycan teichoic acid transferase
MKRLFCLLLAALLLTAVPAAADTYFSLLLIGEDEAGTTLSGAADHGSADALIVVSVSLDSGAIRLLSIERLLKADVPGAGEAPLNIANSIGGPELQLRAVNELFGFDISTYMMVDRSMMGKLVAIVGDVTFDVTGEDLLITMPDGSMAFDKTGAQTISSAQAVALMAAGGADDASGDARRNQRQRDVLIAIVKKTMGTPEFDIILNLVTQIVPMVHTNITMADIVSAAIPVLLHGYSEPGQMRVPENGALTPVNGFQAVIPQDMAAERVRAAAFLYGDK